MESKAWTCIKCETKTYEEGEMRVSGGFWSRIFDVQNKKYVTISCAGCGYTEFYKKPSSMAGNVFDFFTN
ncbi:zinc ribbon domain-containing protein [Gilvimarinus xylanilyticus]|uniref:zinc ribbon domain-containing protein n=1 Tax=Gilvimarinus xylanilyticus TaxID=2944139 RepID=UPI003AF0C1A4